MKKYSFILLALLVGGCAMGINQSVATINGKQYLVEKKTYAAPFYLGIQWADDPEYTELAGDGVQKSSAKNYVKSLYNACYGELSGEPSNEQIYECILSKIK